MSKRWKWFIALAFALGSVLVVRAALLELTYMPVVLSGYPIIPTPTPIPGIYLTDLVYAPTPDPLDEYVEITSINVGYEPMEGWTLNDESGNVYTFPRYTLVTNDTVLLWTRAGQNDPWNLYWGLDAPVWNDHGDCAYLRTDEGRLVDSFCYGSLAR